MLRCTVQVIEFIEFIEFSKVGCVVEVELGFKLDSEEESHDSFQCKDGGEPLYYTIHMAPCQGGGGILLAVVIELACVHC